MSNIYSSYVAIWLLRAICNCIKDSMNTQNSAELTDPKVCKLAFILFSSISSISKPCFNKWQHELKQLTGQSASPQARCQFGRSGKQGATKSRIFTQILGNCEENIVSYTSFVLPVLQLFHKYNFTMTGVSPPAVISSFPLLRQQHTQLYYSQYVLAWLVFKNLHKQYHQDFHAQLSYCIILSLTEN